MNSVWTYVNSRWTNHELSVKFPELRVNQAWTQCEILWTRRERSMNSVRTKRELSLNRNNEPNMKTMWNAERIMEQWARRRLPFGRMKTENHRSDSFIVGIIGTKFCMSTHKMADRRRMATKFIPDSTVRITLFHQERSTRTTHIADGSAARGLPARRAA